MLLYLDGSTGTLIIQTLLAALVAIPFILRTQIARGVSFIRRRGKAATEEDQSPTAD